jgi:hypothetical protein
LEKLEKKDEQKLNQLHLVFGLLFIGSFFLSGQAKKVLPTWNDPEIHLLSLAVAFLWLGTIFQRKVKALDDRCKVLKDRLERAQAKIDWLEREQAEKSPIPRGKGL